MKYSREEVMQYICEEDVKFIRLAFCDVFGRQKNISIMSEELSRAFEYGIAIDASSIAGFGDETHSDLLLHPEAETLMPLPWRPEHGRVVRMLCSISYPDGSPFECDTRSLLKKAVQDAGQSGYRFAFSAEQEFYLFNSMKQEIRPRYRMTKRAIWTSHPKTKEKISAVRSVSLWNRWEFVRKALTTKKDRGRTKSTSAIPTL